VKAAKTIAKTGAKKPGMPVFKPTAEQRKQVMMFAAFGIPQEEMCKLVINSRTNAPIGHKAFEKHFRTELDEGLLRANSFVAGKLFELIRKGHPASIFFWLKTRARWRETNNLALQNPDGTPIDFVDKGKLLAMSAEDLKALLKKLDDLVPMR
jgi:hypothetical protein